MRVNHLFKCFLIPLALVCCFVPAYGSDFTLQGTVKRVTDGDTVHLLTENATKFKIRLLGIDAPESNQSFGPESTQHLINLLQSERITARCVGVDKYKRSLCKLFIKDVDLNLEQVKSGMAWHYKAYASSQSKSDQDIYATAEIEARQSRAGLWVSNLTTPPWEFRKGPKTVKQTSDASKSPGIVKMSRSKICHHQGGRYHAKTTNFTAFKSMGECLAAGGRAPKN
jgi:endonuclease YncB( thermonuclease family)